MTESRREPVDLRAADPEAAAREVAEREGIPFEVASVDVQASIAKREAAVRRIREIREEGQARIAAMDAAGAAAQDGQSARPDKDEAEMKAPPGSAG